MKPNSSDASAPADRRRDDAEPGRRGGEPGIACRRGRGREQTKVTAKPAMAPHSIMPSTPRLSTPLFSTTSSPVAASRIGVVDVDDREERRDDEIEAHGGAFVPTLLLRRLETTVIPAKA